MQHVLTLLPFNTPVALKPPFQFPYSQVLGDPEGGFVPIFYTQPSSCCVPLGFNITNTTTVGLFNISYNFTGINTSRNVYCTQNLINGSYTTSINVTVNNT